VRRIQNLESRIQKSALVVDREVELDQSILRGVRFLGDRPFRRTEPESCRFWILTPPVSPLPKDLVRVILGVVFGLVAENALGVGDVPVTARVAGDGIEDAEWHVALDTAPG
jgi:hypothetical protein